MAISTFSCFHDRPRFQLGLLFITLCATIAPFWVTTVPPSTDLPQHLSQIYLLVQTLAGERADLFVTSWFYPNTLLYWLLWGLWKVVDPITTGRLALSMIASAWVMATFSLCIVRKRPIENWLISLPLIFNFLFYWGLLNFLIGWPIFCLFVSIAGGHRSRLQPVWITLTALLLYYAHALWFVMANAWLILDLINKKPQSLVSYIVPMIPVWILALVWYPKLASSRQTSGFNTDLIWEKMPIARLDFTNITDATLGGLQGQIEPLFILILLAWIAAIIITRYGDLVRETDKSLILATLLLILAYWTFPSKYMNTMLFNQRWLPCGVIMLLLALPAPRVRKLYTYSLGIGCILVFGAATIKAWQNWEEENLSGFMSAIGRIENNDRVFGLDMLGSSLFIKGRPCLQLFSYAQALRGAEINFSFTEHYSGIVQYRYDRAQNISRQLIWMPFQTRREHLLGYSKVLMNGDETLHAFFRKQLNLEEINPSEATWRLYRIIRP